MVRDAKVREPPPLCANCNVLRWILQDAGKEKISDLEARARQGSSEAQARLDALKSQSQQTLASAERKFDEQKAAVQNSLSRSKDKFDDYKDKAYDEARHAVNVAEQKGHEAKQGWFAWLGWGKDKAEDAKKEGAEKVAEASGDVKKAAEKRV